MFNDIIRTWLESAKRRPDLAASTKVAYARIAQHLMAWPAGADDALALPEYVAARRAADIAPRTIALELRVFSVATRWAERHLGAGRPPVLPKVRIDPRVYVLNHRTPTPSQAAAALRAMPQNAWHLAVRLIAATGARVGEVLARRSVDLDMAAGRIALGASEGASKTGMRWVPHRGRHASQPRRARGRGRVPLLDVGDVTPPIQALERRLGRACHVAGVPHFTPHGLRRIVVGRLLRARVDPAPAPSLTAHSIDVMLKHYQEVTDDERRAAAERAMLGVLDGLARDA